MASGTKKAHIYTSICFGRLKYSLCSGRLPREQEYKRNPSCYPVLEHNMVKEGGDTGGGV